ADGAPFTAPAVDRKKLGNGLEVVVHSRPGLPKVIFNLAIRTQDLEETPTNAGVSYMTAALLDEGTESRTSLQIQGELEEFGSYLSISGSKYGANVELASLKKNLGRSFAILSDVLLNPTFP